MRKLLLLALLASTPAYAQTTTIDLGGGISVATQSPPPIFTPIPSPTPYPYTTPIPVYVVPQQTAPVQLLPIHR